MGKAVARTLNELQEQINSLVDNQRMWSSDEIAVCASGLQQIGVKLAFELRKEAERRKAVAEKRSNG